MKREITEKEKKMHEAGMAVLEEIIRKLNGMSNEIERVNSLLTLPEDMHQVAWDAESLIDVALNNLNRIYSAAEEVEL